MFLSSDMFDWCVCVWLELGTITEVILGPRYLTGGFVVWSITYDVHGNHSTQGRTVRLPTVNSVLGLCHSSVGYTPRLREILFLIKLSVHSLITASSQQGLVVCYFIQWVQNTYVNIPTPVCLGNCILSCQAWGTSNWHPGPPDRHSSFVREIFAFWDRRSLAPFVNFLSQT